MVHQVQDLGAVYPLRIAIHLFFFLELERASPTRVTPLYKRSYNIQLQEFAYGFM